jgi:hypothetical protein
VEALKDPSMDEDDPLVSNASICSPDDEGISNEQLLRMMESERVQLKDRDKELMADIVALRSSMGLPVEPISPHSLEIDAQTLDPNPRGILCTEDQPGSGSLVHQFPVPPHLDPKTSIPPHQFEVHSHAQVCAASEPEASGNFLEVPTVPRSPPAVGNFESKPPALTQLWDPMIIQSPVIHSYEDASDATQNSFTLEVTPPTLNQVMEPPIYIDPRMFGEFGKVLENATMLTLYRRKNTTGPGTGLHARVGDFQYGCRGDGG